MDRHTMAIIPFLVDRVEPLAHNIKKTLQPGTSGTTRRDQSDHTLRLRPALVDRQGDHKGGTRP
jgi:hypothetical protein